MHAREISVELTSHAHDGSVDAARVQKAAEILWVAREQLIAFVDGESQVRIDDVVCASRSQELSGASVGAGIQCIDSYTGQELRQ